METQRRVITFGTFDLFHIGHINILRRAAALGDFLTVGVSTDALNFGKKGVSPIFCEDDRLEIVKSIRYVGDVFFEHSLEKKREYITETSSDVLVMGDDWEGKFDQFKDICEVVYLPRTEKISTSLTLEKVRSIK